LLVKGNGWNDFRDSIEIARVFEHTEVHVKENFMLLGNVSFDKFIKFPCLFMQETRHDDSQQDARVGMITNAFKSGKEVRIEYFFDHSIPPLSNQQIQELSGELSIDEFEFSRTHWALKDVDLFKVLLRYMKPRRQLPNVFSISEVERIENSLVSVMMPFDSSFSGVFETIKASTHSLGLHCRRADDIWENPAIIQDIVSLIDHSKVIICDCTGRNPNVFYEIGIAHTLGREVILITQNEHDVPFDLRHLRFVKYLNNGEGLKALGDALLSKIRTFI
jgi:hypothetical protein